MITDQEAQLLTRNFARIDPARQEKAKSLLQQYRDGKQARGLEPFQPAPEETLAKSKRYEGMFADLSKAEEFMAPEQRQRVSSLLAMTGKPDEVKAAALNQAYVLDNHPEMNRPGFDESWDVVRGQYAKAVLGIDKPQITDGELYAAIGGHLQKQAEKRQRLTDVATKVYEAAMGGAPSWLDAYKGFGASATDPQEQAEMRTVAQRVYGEFQGKIAPVRPLVELGRDYYVKALKEGATDEVRAMGEQFTEGLIGLSGEQRMLAYQAAVVMASKQGGTRGEQGSAGTMEKAAVGVERAIGDLAGNAIAFAKQATLAGVKAYARMGTGLDNARAIAGVERERDRDRVARMVQDGFTGAVDLVKAGSILEKMVLGTTQSLPYLAASATMAGLPVTIASMAEDARAQLEDAGVASDEAVGIGFVSGAIQAGLERIPASMIFKGKLPFEKAMAKWLQGPILSKAGVVKRLAGVGGVQLVGQNLEELAQDITTPVAQEVGSWLSDSVPDVKWTGAGGVLEDIAKGRVDTFWALLPLVVMGTGTATFKDAGWGRKYLEDRRKLLALGMDEKTATGVLDATTLEAKQELVKAWYADTKREGINSELQAAAFAELDAEMQASYGDIAQEGGAQVVRMEDGSWAVLDSKGETVDVAADAESALDLAREVATTEEATLSQGINDMIGYLEGSQEPGQRVELVQKKQTLSDQIKAGLITEQEAKQAVEVAVSLGALREGTQAKDVRVLGENRSRYNARTRIFEDVSRIYDGGHPLTVVEEHAEGYIKRRLHEGTVSLDDIAKWREAVDGPGGAAGERALIEWFSNAAKAYIVDNQNAAAIPPSFRAFLRKLKQYLAQVTTMAAKLREMGSAGTLPKDLQTHLARSVGLDEAWQERLFRQQEAAAMDGQQGVALSQWAKGKLPHPDTAAAAGDPLAGELRMIWDAKRKTDRNGDMTDNAARAYFAPKGQEVQLDRLVEAARAEGFEFETPAELLAAVDDALRGNEVYGEARMEGQTYALEEIAQNEQMLAKYRERRVTERINKGEHKGQAFSQELRDRVEKFMYQVEPNKKTVEEALAIVSKQGLSGAVSMAMSDIGVLPPRVHAALLLGLTEHFDRTGDSAMAQQLAERAAELGTQLGQGVQIFSLLGRVVDSPDKARIFVERQVKRMETDIRKRIPAIDQAEIELGEAVERERAKAPKTEKEVKQAKERIIKTVVDRMKSRDINTPEDLKRAMRKLLDKHGLEITPEDIKKALREKLKVPSLSEADQAQLEKLALNIQSTPENSTERTDATMAFMDFVNDKLKGVDMVEWVWAVWYANILSGYNTHLRNMWGNTVSAGLELGMAAASPNPIEAVKRVGMLFSGVREGISLGAGEAGQALKTGRSTIVRSEIDKWSASSALEKVTVAGGKANPLNWLKYVQRLLAAEDLFAFSTAQEAYARIIAYEMAKADGLEGEALAKQVERLLNQSEEQIADFNERAAQEWDRLTEDLREGKDRSKWIARRVKELQLMERSGDLIERASSFGTRATFNYQPDGVVGIMAGSLMRVLGSASRMQADTKGQKVLKLAATSPKLVIPFIRIAANVLNRGIDFTGFGVVRYAFDQKLILDGAGKVGTEAKTADEKRFELTRGIFGIGVMALVAAYSDPDDEDAPFRIHGAGAGNKATNQAQNGPNWMPYSVEFKIGRERRFVSYQYNPLALGLAIIGSLHDAKRYKKFNEQETHERLAVAISGAGSVILEQSFLSNAADVLKMLGSGPEASEKALYTFLGRTFNPAQAVPFANLIRNVADTFDPVKRDQTSIKASLMANVPIARTFNNPALDILGDNLQNRPFDWFTRAEEDGTPEARIYQAFATKNVHPTQLWHWKGKMEPDQFYQFTKLRGQYLKDLLLADGGRRLTQLEQATDEKAEKLMARLSERARDKALRAVGYKEAKADE